MSKTKKTNTKKKTTTVAGYSCARCLFGGLAPDEVTVNAHGQVVCFDCVRVA